MRKSCERMSIPGILGVEVRKSAKNYSVSASVHPFDRV